MLVMLRGITRMEDHKILRPVRNFEETSISAIFFFNFVFLWSKSQLFHQPWLTNPTIRRRLPGQQHPYWRRSRRSAMRPPTITQRRSRRLRVLPSLIHEERDPEKEKRVSSQDEALTDLSHIFSACQGTLRKNLIIPYVYLPQLSGGCHHCLFSAPRTMHDGHLALPIL